MAKLADIRACAFSSSFIIYTTRSHGERVSRFAGCFPLRNSEGSSIQGPILSPRDDRLSYRNIANRRENGRRATSTRHRETKRKLHRAAAKGSTGKRREKKKLEGMATVWDSVSSPSRASSRPAVRKKTPRPRISNPFEIESHLVVVGSHLKIVAALGTKAASVTKEQSKG